MNTLEKLGAIVSDPDPEVEKFARFILDRRLEVPALLILECCVPLSNVIHTAALFTEPVGAPLLGAARYKELLELFADRAKIERLIALLQR